MLITLHIKDLLSDIKKKSHYEVAGIEDAEARYRIEAGTEKEDEIYRSMVEVESTLVRRLHRFLYDHYQDEADNQLALPESFSFEFEMTDRRSGWKAQELADLMHSYIVHYTLAKFYAAVSQTDLSNKHSALTAEAATALEECLYHKQPPML